MTLSVQPRPTDRRDGIVRLLTGTPGGLSDADLARSLGSGVRPQTVNTVCRRLVAEGVVERTGTRPILNRLVPTKKKRTRRPRTNGNAPVPATPSTDEAAAAAPGAVAPAEVDGPSEDSPVIDVPVTDVPVAEVPADEVPGSAESPAPVAEHDAEPPPPVPTRDALQGWSRTVNVRAAVADWLTRRGGTLRSVAGDGRGPASDLVVSLDGDDVHVEVTGWPPDGVRTHTTTIAGDWFAAAENAAAQRRRRHPDARVVIALPDTRRYRTLAEHRAHALAGSRAEVWFVDPAGAVAPR